MKKFLLVWVFGLTTPITLPLAILWCGFDAWRVTIEREAVKVVRGMKE